MSVWWKEVSFLGSSSDSTTFGWFSKGVAKVIGNGLSTSFGNDPWVGELPLKVLFPQLFQVSNQCGGKVGQVGNWEGDLSV
jgi:hypothetical protein